MEKGKLLRHFVIEILKFMGEQGIRYRERELEEVIQYAELMVKAERVIAVKDKGSLVTIIFFSICRDWEQFLKKPTWRFLSHDPDGDTFYGEKIVSTRWDKDIRTGIKELLLSRYPNLQLAKWHRWGKTTDRPVTVRRRIYV